MTADPLELLTELVATKSLSREEEAIKSIFSARLSTLGLSPEVGEHGVVVTLEGAEPGPTVLLNSHLDTVPAGEGWTTDPWTPTVKDGRLYGLGSGDAKGSVAAMACAVASLAGRIKSGKLIFAATVMEEVGHGGLEILLPELGHVDAALIGEPTQLQPALAQGGLLILKGRATGKTAHAARAHQGENALLKAAADILSIASIELDRVHPLLGTSLINVTIANAGTRHNVIPDVAEFVVDVRYTPSYTPEALTELVRAACTAGTEIRVHSDRLRSIETADTSDAANAMAKCNPNGTFFGSPTMSDWVHMKGIDGIKIGPGESERSHTPNESIDIAELYSAVDIYRGWVANMLGLVENSALTETPKGAATP